MPDPATQVTSSEQLSPLAEFRFRLRKFLSFSEAVCERAGIQTQQYQLMQVIAAAGDKEQTSISYLADRMVLRHNSTVELVDRAEKANLVARHSDAKDLRRSIVRMTPHGEAIFHTLVQEHIAEVKRSADDLISSLSAVRDTE